MYQQPSTLTMTGLTGSGLAGTGLALGLPLGWLLLAVFVLAMAVVALVAIWPRRRREVRKVNPPAASRMRLHPGG
ncbi:hypothetical protein ACT8ZV_13740 [Nocardioides sp. MAHUQ-72]|uniref:hypothetical protein n=1 Tax=unclassified Nocardioides TaxID=2615069 RepID=UPI00360A2123